MAFPLDRALVPGCQVLWHRPVGYTGVFQVGDALVWYRFDQLTGLRAPT